MSTPDNFELGKEQERESLSNRAYEYVLGGTGRPEFTKEELLSPEMEEFLGDLRDAASVSAESLRAALGKDGSPRLDQLLTAVHEAQGRERHDIEVPNNAASPEHWLRSE